MNKPVELSEHPPALTEAYHKARRSYVLFSALLIAWELIGFEVNEVPLENINITIKSPQAIPAVLIVLMGYFALRLVQEWYQCDARRRKDNWALSDVASAHVIAVGAIGIYTTQRLLERQLANLVSDPDASIWALCFVTGLLLMQGYRLRKVFSQIRRLKQAMVAVSVTSIAFIVLINLITDSVLPIWILIVGGITSFILGGAVGIALFPRLVYIGIGKQ